MDTCICKDCGDKFKSRKDILGQETCSNCFFDIPVSDRHTNIDSKFTPKDIKLVDTFRCKCDNIILEKNGTCDNCILKSEKYEDDEEYDPEWDKNDDYYWHPGFCEDGCGQIRCRCDEEEERWVC